METYITAYECLYTDEWKMENGKWQTAPCHRLCSQLREKLIIIIIIIVMAVCARNEYCFGFNFCMRGNIIHFVCVFSRCHCRRRCAIFPLIYFFIFCYSIKGTSEDHTQFYFSNDKITVPVDLRIRFFSFIIIIHLPCILFNFVVCRRLYTIYRLQWQWQSIYFPFFFCFHLLIQ